MTNAPPARTLPLAALAALALGLRRRGRRLPGAGRRPRPPPATQPAPPGPAAGLAPQNQDRFDSRYVGARMTSPPSGGHLDFVSAGRFRETEGADSYSGSYAYTRTGADSGRLALRYDGGERCTVAFTLAPAGGGTSSYSCDGGGSGAPAAFRVGPIPAPDLAVGPASADPADPYANAPLALSATVRNAGAGASAATTLRWYRSADATISALDAEVGAVQVGELAAGASQGAALDLSAPADAGIHHYGACADAVAGESDSGNNCSAAALVTVRARPDLAVGPASASPASAAPGARLGLSATVRNDGDGASAATTLRWRRSADATISASDTEVGAVQLGELAAGGTSDESLGLSAPADAGTHFYGACADPVAGESDSGNNCSAAASVTVRAGLAPPDQAGFDALLVGSRAASPASPDALDFVSAGRFRETEGAETRLGSYAWTRTGADSGTLALRYDDGDRCAVALTLTSAGGGTSSFSCDDGSSGGPSAFRIEPIPAPDLAVGPASASPASLAPGAQLGLSATVRNDGDGASAATTLRWYRSADATISASDAEVGTDDVDALAAGGTSGESLSLQAPANAGTYHYGACADAVAGESDTANNCSAAASVTVVARPDLAVQSVSADPADPFALAPLALSATVRNDGDGASAATTLRWYRSADATISRSDAEVGAVQVGELAAGGTSDESLGLQAPADAGIHFYGACADPVAGESDSGNNCSAAALVTVRARPDLAVQSVSADPSDPYSNAPLALSATVRNDGAGASAATTLRWYRSADATITASDAEVGAVQVGELAAGGTSDESLGLQAPADAGTHFYGACAVPVAGESDTANNCSGAVAVTVVPPDLAVQGTRADPASAFFLDAGNDEPAGIAHAGGRLLVVDSFDGKVYAYSTTGQRGAAADFGLDPGNDHPAGIAHAGGRLLVVDSFDDKVYAYSASGQRDAAADFGLGAGNGSPGGIAQAGGRLYVVDFNDDKAYAYSAGGQRDQAADFDLDAGNGDPLGIAHAGGRLLVVDSADGKVYAYSTAGQRDQAADFELDPGNGSPAGIAHAGGRLLVVDWADKKVYAYSAGGQRDAAADLDLHGGSPAGIAHAGGRLFVVDSGGDRVYSYPFPVGPGGAGAPVDAPSGAPLTLLAAVRNAGADALAATTLRWYRSADAAISTSDTEVGADRVGELAAGASEAETLAVFAPADAGTYFYGACAVPVAGESDTANNCSGAVAVTVVPPDLAVQGARADPASAFFLDAGNDHPAGIAHAGGRLLVVDSFDDKVYAYSASGQRDAAADFGLGAGNGHPAGIAQAGGRLYVVDSFDDKVYAYSTTGRRDAAADFGLDAGNGDPLGIAHAGGRLLVVDWTDKKVYAYSAAGQRDQAADFELDPGNGSPAGIAHAGGRLLVVDWADKKVYAYSAAGQRDAAADLDLHGGSPAGIAHAGGRLFVVDSGGDRVYSYPFPVGPGGAGAPVDAPSGAPLTLLAAVRNAGADALAATTLRWYRSADAAISTSDTEVGADRVGELAAGASEAETLAVFAPADAGTYFYGACAVPVAGESDTANNCSGAVAVTVVPPDLAVQGARADPASAFFLDAGNDHPAGIAHAGGRLLVVDSFDDKVYAYSASGQRDAAADFGLGAGNGHPAGIAQAGGRLYVVDSFDDKVYAYSTTGRRDAAADFGLDAGNGDPLGIAHAGGRLLVVDWTDKKVYAYSAAGQRDQAADFELDPGNGSPAGIAHAGGRLLVVDWADKKVYAYSAAGQRDAAADLDLHGGSPAGIAHAGGRLFVVDSGGDRVYSYPFPVGPGGAGAPVDAPSGAPLTLLAAVRNAGADALAATTLRWYRSADAAISTSDTEVGADRVGELAAGASEAETLAVFAPADAGTYFYGACAVPVAGESDTANNCSGAVAVTVVPPDLAVQGARADPASAFFLDAGNDHPAGIAHAGGRLLVVDSFDDKVYAYSASGQRDAAADFGLGAGNGHPAGIAQAGGRLYVVDSFDDKVYAYSTTGRRDAAADFGLDAGNGDPLGIAHAGGRLLVVDWTDKKVYAYSAAGQRDQAADFELDPGNGSPAGIAHAGGRLLVVDWADKKVYAYSAAGQRDAAADLDLHGGSPAGIAHAGGRLFVVDSGGDRVYSYPFPVGPGGAGAPVDAPLGAPLTLLAAVRNAGADALAATTLRWYRSADAAISTSDTEVGADRVGELAAGASEAETLAVFAPADAGTYFYGACAVPVAGESDTANNCSGAVAVTVVPPDLAVQGARADPASAFFLDAGNDEPAGIAHAGGRLLVVDSFDDKVYAYSASGQRDAAADFGLGAGNDDSYGIAHAGGRLLVVDWGDDKVYAYSASGQRDAAADFGLDADNGSPAGIAHAGGRLLVVDSFDDKVYAYSASGQRGAAADFGLDPGNGSPGGIAHAGGRLFVVDSGGDRVYSYPFPVGPGGAGAPVDAPLGAPLTLLAAVRNAGAGALAATTLRWYRSADAVISTSDTEVGADRVGALAAGASEAETLAVFAPADAGTYHYGACAVPVAGESDTANNCSATAAVTVRARPDLAVGPASANPASAATGAQLGLSATVRNDGDGASAATTLRWYRSADATISASDAEVGTDDVDALAAGGTSDESLSLQAPADAGTYHYGACADPVAGESDTANNCSAAALVTVSAPAEPEPVPLDGLRVQPGQVSFGFFNTAGGCIQLDGSFLNGVAHTISGSRWQTRPGPGGAWTTVQGTERSDDRMCAYTPSAAGDYRLVVDMTIGGTAGVHSSNVILFAPGPARLTVIAGDHGSVAVTIGSSAAATVASGAQRAFDVAAPSAVRLEAGADPGWRVSGWSLSRGACQSTAVPETCQLPGSAFSGGQDLSAEPVYAAVATTLTVTAGRGGSVSVMVRSDPAETVAGGSSMAFSVNAEASATLTAEPAAGWRFADWDAEGACAGQAAACELEAGAFPADAAAGASFAPLRPDLVAQDVSTAGSTPTAGSSFTLTATVRNIGGAASSSATALRWYRSANLAITPSDVELGTSRVPALAASGGAQSIGFTALIDLRAPPFPGTYRYGACVDAVAGESDTENNCSSAAIVTVSSSDGVCVVDFELAGGDVSLPVDLSGASTATLNAGTGTVDDPFTVSFMIAENSVQGFEIVLDEPRSLLATATSDLDTQAAFVTGDCAPVGAVTQDRGPVFGGLGLLDFVYAGDLAAGTYYLVVYEWQGRAGSYALAFAAFDGDGVNQAPVIAAIDDQELALGDTMTVDIDISDDFGDTQSVVAVSLNRDAATVELRGRRLLVTSAGAGSATVLVAAVDQLGAEGAPVEFNVTVRASVPPAPTVGPGADPGGLDIGVTTDFAGMETRAYDYQVRANRPQTPWVAVGCQTFTNSRVSALSGVTASTTAPNLLAGVTFDARYRYRNSPSCDSGAPGSWSAVGTGASNGTAANQAPAFFAGMAEREMLENTPGGVNVGAPVAASDADALDALRYSLSGTDSGNFQVVPETGQIRTRDGVSYDYETKSAYFVDVVAQDAFGATDRISVTIHLVDLVPNCAPPPRLRLNAGDRQLTVRWSPLDDHASRASVLGYEVERRGTGGAWGDRLVIHGRTASSAAYTGLTNDAEYDVRVRPFGPEEACGWPASVSGAPTTDKAPEDGPDFADRVPPDMAMARYRFPTDDRCRRTVDGQTLDGSYRYEKTGPDRGLITLEFDEAGRAGCAISLAFSSLTAGSFLEDCEGAGVNTDVDDVEPEDLFTGFTIRAAPMPPPSQWPQNMAEFDALVFDKRDLLPGFFFGRILPPFYGGVFRSEQSGAFHQRRRSGRSFSIRPGFYLYESTGQAMGRLTLSFNLGSTWVLDLDFLAPDAAEFTLTITIPGRAPTVSSGFIDFAGDENLSSLPPELLPPGEPPQASGKDLSGVEAAAAATPPSIGPDSLQTMLVENSGVTDIAYSPGDWLEPKDGGDQRMMIVGPGSATAMSSLAARQRAAGTMAQTAGPASAELTPLRAVCMQREKGIPVRGSRFFSRPKPPQGTVERCQRDCVLAGGDGIQGIQGCVWSCQTGNGEALAATGTASGEPRRAAGSARSGEAAAPLSAAARDAVRDILDAIGGPVAGDRAEAGQPAVLKARWPLER